MPTWNFGRLPHPVSIPQSTEVIIATVCRERVTAVLWQKAEVLATSNFSQNPLLSEARFHNQATPTKAPHAGGMAVTVGAKHGSPILPISGVPSQPDSPPSRPASLSPQQSAMHTCPVVQAPSADLDVWQDSLCFPVAQSAAANWQPCQQPLLVNETNLAKRSRGRKICLLAVHVAALLLIMEQL